MSYKYKRIFVPGHPTAMADGWMKEHRYIAEIKLGRLLKSEEVVHHIDEDKFNNDPNNLMVFKTNADHSAFHMGCEAVLDGDVYWCPNKNDHISLCPECNKRYMEKKSKMCTYCYHLLSRKVKDRPSKEELFELLKKQTFITVGKIYGVSDNTVRKWCRAYDLPCKRKDIDKLIL